MKEQFTGIRCFPSRRSAIKHRSSLPIVFPWPIQMRSYFWARLATMLYWMDIHSHKAVTCIVKWSLGYCLSFLMASLPIKTLIEWFFGGGNLCNHLRRGPNVIPFELIALMNFVCDGRENSARWLAVGWRGGRRCWANHQGVCNKKLNIIYVTSQTH